MRFIREILDSPGPDVLVPIGDDSTEFRFPSPDVLLTVDSLYEGVHFDLTICDLYDVGYRAATAGISDIAAMGGEPLCVLLSIAFSQAPTSAEVLQLLGGLREVSTLSGCELVGGDVCRSPGGLALTVSVAGSPPEGGPVLRGGAREGDIIGVTGYAGGSAAGLFALRHRDDAREKFPGLVEAYLRPKPRVLAGRILGERGVSAMEDVSDGIAPDIRDICSESGLGCEIRVELIPVSNELEELAREASIDPLRWALSGGEEYELLFTASPGRFEGVLKTLEELKIPASRIGVMSSAGERCLAVTARGETIELEGMGYDHFA